MATENQIEFLKSIVEDYNFDGNRTWISNVANTPKQKGVFSRALDAGLVGSNGESVWLTEAGKIALDAELWEPVSEEEEERIITEECKKIRSRKASK